LAAHVTLGEIKTSAAPTSSLDRSGYGADHLAAPFEILSSDLVVRYLADATRRPCVARNQGSAPLQEEAAAPPIARITRSPQGVKYHKQTQMIASAIGKIAAKAPSGTKNSRSALIKSGHQAEGGHCYLTCS
jgi:hypothetical protein